MLQSHGPHALKPDKQRIAAFRVTCQQRILGVRWFRFVTSAAIVNQTGLDSVTRKNEPIAAFCRICHLKEATSEVRLTLHYGCPWKLG